MKFEEFSKLVKSSEDKSTIVINKSMSPVALLGVAFVVLKLLGYITWSWWWVLAPFWIPFLLVLLILGGLAIYIVYTTKLLNKEIEECATKGTGTYNTTKSVETKEEIPVKKIAKKSKKKANGSNDNETKRTKK